ncbi:MAG: HINT domain-containing protein [Planctomycetes bacterium]|nr:HINT domain-containing protein [Planctomycetota bacterium]
MSSRARGRRSRRRAFEVAAIGVFAALLGGGPAAGKDAKDYTTAERLVASARQAEIDGDTEKCYRLLREAVRVVPDFTLARWQLGQMQVDGQWLAVEEAQRRAAADPKQAQYRELRQSHGETPQGQLALARWCRKNNLNDEARFHWASVLSVDPSNEEALRAVDMRWQNGQLLTREQAAQQKEELRELKLAEKHWSPTIAKWQRAVSGSDSAERGKALNEIRTLKATDAILPLEKVTLGRDGNQKKPSAECRRISLAFLDALGKMREQAATESLVRHAAFSPMIDSRIDATEKLKVRPLHDYVPLLLSGLEMPIESSFSVTNGPDGSVHYRHTLYKVGPTADWSIQASYGAWQHFAPEVAFLPGESNDVLAPRQASQLLAKARRMGRNAARYEREFGATAIAVEVQVAKQNHASELRNGRIFSVLAQTTGESFESPRQWWDWWQTYNEYYAPEERPVYEQHHVNIDHHYYPPPTMFSCFAKGTLVWTKTGQRPIESLELGELVLAQDVNSGELAYKPVIGRTVRPPSEILSVGLHGEEIRTTLGHPFWVAGAGWQMAKELDDGEILHGLTGSTRVSAVKPAGPEEAFNLVVADFNTYFVGESGVLVHDNTPRMPTRAIVPGLAAK